MKNDVFSLLTGLLIGFLLSAAFRFFWKHIYPHMGVEWNVYTRYAIELTFLFVVIIAVALFYKKREKWQTEESQ